MDLLHDLILKLMLTAKGRERYKNLFIFLLSLLSGHLAEAVLSPEMKAKDFYLTKKFFFFLYNELKKQFTKLN